MRIMTLLAATALLACAAWPQPSRAQISRSEIDCEPYNLFGNCAFAMAPMAGLTVARATFCKMPAPRVQALERAYTDAITAVAESAADREEALGQFRSIATDGIARLQRTDEPQDCRQHLAAAEEALRKYGRR